MMMMCGRYSHNDMRNSTVEGDIDVWIVGGSSLFMGSNNNNSHVMSLVQYEAYQINCR